MDRSATQEPGRDAPGQWARVLWLDREIRAGSHPCVADLQQEFDISRRAAFNAVAFLRDSLGAPLRYRREKRGYEYEDPTFALPAVFLREGEMLALLLAEEVSRQYLGTPVETPLREAIGKISQFLPDEVRLELGELADAFHFSGGSHVEVSLALLGALRQAVGERRVVRLLYHTASRNETRERDIEPHFLANIRGDWMVAAWDRWRGEPRFFLLARVLEHQLLAERFTPHRPELDARAYSERAFQTEYGSEPYEVALRFDSTQARWIRERRWHPGRRIEELPEGMLILRLRVAGIGDLLRWILGYGSHVEVLEPAWLRERVAEEAGRMAGLYDGQPLPPFQEGR